MTIYFTSDTHWGHKNILKYSNRPYKDVDEMNQHLIINWNSRVRPEDTIYHLGDFSFLDVVGTKKVLDRLQGRIFFCRGNHDQVLEKNKHLQDRFEDVHDYYELKFQKKNGEGGHIVMSHFAMLVWNKSHRGSYMLHGHSHGSLKYPHPMRIMDVGVDPQKYFPISLEEVEKHMEKIDTQPVDHHGTGRKTA